MQLEGFFSNIKTANETVERLKKAGFDKAFFDMNDHYIDERNVQTNLPGTDTAVSLSGLILESSSDGLTRDLAPLKAADPMVSGMGRFDEIADFNCKVIVDVSEPELNKAKKIIQDMGGELESPNIRKPKLKSDEK